MTNRVPIIQKGESYPHIADCDYFTVDKLDLDGRLLYRMQGNVGKESFLSILILDGSGTISNQGEKIAYQKGDSIFLPAGSGDFTIEGTCDALLTTIREKANPVRGGIVIGSAGIQIGLVDEANHIFAKKEFSTDTSKTPSEIIQETADAALKLLQENNVPLDQCIGIGVGVPGTVDRRSGTIIYSKSALGECQTAG